ncbi:MAG: 16S rRNA (guanine(527)-N(7))-methyltransferase RsmG [Polymorphobacter sp.]|uniref:16S rRNA (guanine(527)-N(7))-methyltransferase RsmG n=1 Tax=Polymorphobacter sp. TaxID=1909290 RepID=UPI003A84104E
MDKLDRYAALLADWQTRMNLVGPSTLPQLWHRHFADSAQLLPVAGPGRTWLDIGAGAGFPGLVIATLDPGARVTLVESIAKKCRFLETVVSDLQLDDRVTVENRRIEDLPPRRFDVITARALAAVTRLLGWGRPFAGRDTLWLLPKGARWSEELDEARRAYRFKVETRPSLTDEAARLLLIRGVAAS